MKLSSKWISIGCAISLMFAPFNSAFGSTGNKGARSFKSQLCNSGVVVIISIPGQEKDREAPQHQNACHAICSKGQESDED